VARPAEATQPCPALRPVTNGAGHPSATAGALALLLAHSAGQVGSDICSSPDGLDSACSAGAYCNDYSCLPCIPGTYQTLTSDLCFADSDGYTACTACVAGTYSSLEGADSECTACQLGSYLGAAPAPAPCATAGSIAPRWPAARAARPLL
jgi:hypothetical protein